MITTKPLRAALLACICLGTLTLRADELFPVLKVNGSVYSNVTVTTVTATDIFFTDANGVGNAKLKNLTPELQKHFHYDAAKAALVEKQAATNNAEYHQYVLSVKPPPAVQDESRTASDDEDFVAPKLYAKSVRGQVLPAFPVEEWLTPQPDCTGKFVLIDYWATSSGPCRDSIPQLNAFFEKYHDRLVVIGVTDETEAVVRRMTDPHIEYAVAIDTQARMMKALQITGIPHCILLDPQRVVRYEGLPGYLDEARLEHFLDKYK